jgi:hypothetical protein
MVSRSLRLLVVGVVLPLAGACSDDGDQVSATTIAPDAASIALRGDGVAVADLGDRADAAVAAVTGSLGEPTGDSGWDPPEGAYGTCPGDRVRAVEWGGLVLLFADGGTEVGRGEHLFGWRVTGAPPAVATATGLGFGATADDAEDLYPGAIERVEAEPPFPAHLVVEVEGGPITAFLDAAGAITNLEAGVPCGE